MKLNNWEKEFDKKWSDVTYTPKSKYEAFVQIADDIKSFIRKVRQEALEGAINLSDKIETERETTLEEWKAFKHFRNAMRDRLKVENIKDN